MHYRATILAAAGLWAAALSGQTPTQQPAVMPQALTVRPETERALRDLVKKYTEGQTGVCAIPLLTVPVPKNLEQMPVLRPRPDYIDKMPSVKLPAPPCEEAKR